MEVILTCEEAREIYKLIDELSGGNARDSFAWEGLDDPADVRTTALAKVFKAAGKPVPQNLR